MRTLYKFYWDCGRMGELEGFFLSTPEEIDRIVGKELYFGECLGKHSEISGPFQKKDVTELTTDQDFIEKAIKYKLVPSGFNPFGALRKVFIIKTGNDGDDAIIGVYSTLEKAYRVAEHIRDSPTIESFDVDDELYGLVDE